MRHSWKNAVAGISMFALLLAMTPTVSAGGGARLGGTLTQPDGRPAEGYAVHLIDSEGQAVATARTGDRGTYAFKRLPGDNYSLGIENPAGQMAPVMASPVRLRSGDRAEFDVKLMETGPGAGGPSGNYALGIWWAGLSTPAKIWTIVGTVAVLGITVSALDDDEETTSPF